jgi:hypothetical protein
VAKRSSILIVSAALDAISGLLRASGHEAEPLAQELASLASDLRDLLIASNSLDDSDVVGVCSEIRAVLGDPECASAYASALARDPTMRELDSQLNIECSRVDPLWPLARSRDERDPTS